MKKSLLLLLFLCAPALAEDSVMVWELKPSEFAQTVNQKLKGNFRKAQLRNIYGEQKVSLTPQIALDVGTHTDAIEFVDVKCNQILAKGVVEKCITVFFAVGETLDPQFNRTAFINMVGRNIDRGVSVAYRQNGAEYHVIPDDKRKQLRMEVQILD